MSQKLKRRAPEQGTARRNKTIYLQNSTPRASKGKACARCKLIIAPHKRMTLGGTHFRVCEPCSALMQTMTIAALISLQEQIDQGVTCHAPY